MVKPRVLRLRLIWTLIMTGTFLMIVPSLSAQQSDSAVVVAAVDAFHTALSSGDSAAVLALLADDAVIMESGGAENKDHYSEHHMPGDMAFIAAVTRERGEMAVVVNGDVAWASSASVTQGTFREREINSQGAELMVLSRTDSGWKIRAIHWSSRRRR